MTLDSRARGAGGTLKMAVSRIGTGSLKRCVVDQVGRLHSIILGGSGACTPPSPTTPPIFPGAVLRAGGIKHRLVVLRIPWDFAIYKRPLLVHQKDHHALGKQSSRSHTLYSLGCEREMVWWTRELPLSNSSRMSLTLAVPGTCTRMSDGCQCIRLGKSKVGSHLRWGV